MLLGAESADRRQRQNKLLGGAGDSKMVQLLQRVAGSAAAVVVRRPAVWLPKRFFARGGVSWGSGKPVRIWSCGHAGLLVIRDAAMQMASVPAVSS